MVQRYYCKFDLFNEFVQASLIHLQSLNCLLSRGPPLLITQRLDGTEWKQSPRDLTKSGVRRLGVNVPGYKQHITSIVALLLLLNYEITVNELYMRLDNQISHGACTRSPSTCPVLPARPCNICHPWKLKKSHMYRLGSSTASSGSWVWCFQQGLKGLTLRFRQRVNSDAPG